MKNLLINIGKKSKKAVVQKLSSQQKDKVLKDYYYLINKNRKLIISENKRDIKSANKKKIKKYQREMLCYLNLQKNLKNL